MTPHSPLRLRRTSLLARFAVLSAVPLLVLGAVLGLQLRASTRERTLDNARFAAELIGRLGVQAHITPRQLREGLSYDEILKLDQIFTSEAASERIARIKVWNAEGKVVYSDHHGHIGERLVSAELLGALEGRVSMEVEQEENASLEDAAELVDGPKLEIYVPIDYGDGPPQGAFEVYMPYEPLARDAAADARRLTLIAIGGILVVYLVLHRIVAQASRSERRYARRLEEESRRNEYLAHHDTLTGLPNRTLFALRAERALEMARASGQGAALLLMDLDRFKELNDTFGHRYGDLLLKQVGPRLEQAVPDGSLAARLGGDEFAVLLAGVADAAEAEQAAARVLAALQGPFDLDGLEADADASVGIALFPSDGSDIDTLLQKADVAMYLAKESHAPCRVYREEDDRHSPDRLALVRELRRALERDEIVLVYQPKVAVATGELLGVEALARWDHPERGLLGPDRFIDLAERTGMMPALTRLVLRKALLQLGAWERQGLRTRVAVNVSARNLLDGDLPSDVLALLAETGRSPADLELEVTETMIMADPERALRVLGELRSMGVSVALDDFGTGYSSLSYLKSLPMDALKIDRSFVMHMCDEPRDAAIVRSTIELARNLGLVVVAEGVETETTLQQLVNLGCDHAQGYLMAPPLRPAEVAQWAAARPARTPA